MSTNQHLWNSAGQTARWGRRSYDWWGFKSSLRCWLARWIVKEILIRWHRPPTAPSWIITICPRTTSLSPPSKVPTSSSSSVVGRHFIVIKCDYGSRARVMVKGKVAPDCLPVVASWALFPRHQAPATTEVIVRKPCYGFMTNCWSLISTATYQHPKWLITLSPYRSGLMVWFNGFATPS